MILRIAMLVLIALGLLGFGLIAWAATRNPGAQEVHPTSVAVLTAAHDIRPGTLLKPEDIVAARLPKSDVPPGATVDVPKARRGLVGAMVRRALTAGDVIAPRDVMRPGDHGFLAAVLDPGMRATTVGVDMVSGTAGLIWPGDRVDVILTESFADPAVPPAHKIGAEIALSDIRVIAIDQRLVEGAAPDDSPGKETRTVTLEVTSAQAERLAVASRLGHLSLAVRAAVPAPGGTHPHPPTTWAGDVVPALASTVRHAAPDVVRVFQGASDGKEFRF